MRPFAVCSDVKVGRRLRGHLAARSCVPGHHDAESSRTDRGAASPPGDAAHDGHLLDLPVDRVDHAAQTARACAAFDLSSATRRTAPPARRSPARTSRTSCACTTHGYIAAGQAAVYDRHAALVRRPTKTKADQERRRPCSMDDEALFGPEFHRLGFGEAVEQGLLTDYKVIVLAVEEEYVATDVPEPTGRREHRAQPRRRRQDRRLLERSVRAASAPATTPCDGEPMRRAVAFSRTIKDSKRITASSVRSPSQLDVRRRTVDPLTAIAHHVDGTFNALQTQRRTGLAQEPD